MAPTLTATLQSIIQKRKMEREDEELRRRQLADEQANAIREQRLALEEKRANARFKTEMFDRNSRVRGDAVKQARSGVTMPFQEFDAEGNPITVTPVVRSFQGMSVGDYTAGTDDDPTMTADFEQNRQPPRKELVFNRDGVEGEVIDLGAMDKYDETMRKEKLANIERQISDPSVPAVVKAQLMNNAVELRAAIGTQGLSKDATGAMYKATAEEQRQVGREKLTQMNIDSKEKIASEKIALAKLKKLNAGVSGPGSGSELSKLPLTKQNQVNMMATRLLRSNLTFMNWQKLTGPGTDRLRLAKLNIEAEGPNAAAQHVEAMMNFFGYIRGGVPAENETKVWEQMTSKLSTYLDKAGAMLGKPNLGQRLSGGNIQADELRQTWSGMPPEQRAGLIRAINESIDFVRTSAKKSIIATQQAFEPYGPPVKEAAIGALNSLATFVGLPKQQWFSDVKERASTAIAPNFEGEQDSPKKDENLGALINELKALRGAK
jgi:hypothetical protein